MRKTKFRVTRQNWDLQFENEKKRIKEMACDLVLLYMYQGDSKGLACRKVSFDLSVQTALIEELVKDNEIIKERTKLSQHGKKKFLRLDFVGNGSDK